MRLWRENWGKTLLTRSIVVDGFFVEFDIVFIRDGFFVLKNTTTFVAVLFGACVVESVMLTSQVIFVQKTLPAR